MAEQAKQAVADAQPDYIGVKITGKARVTDGTASDRWPACEACGNEVANTIYKEEGKSATGAPILNRMLECSKCGLRRQLDTIAGG